jgi:DNA-binding transcriptional LysR family regulator
MSSRTAWSRRGADAEPYTLTIEGRLAAAGLGGEIIPIDGLTAQKRMVEAGFGLGVFPASSVDEELHAGTLRTLAVRALQATIDVVLIHRRRAYLNGATQRLMTALSPWDVSDSPRATRRRRTRARSRAGPVRREPGRA